jgi:hypothetical protein
VEALASTARLKRCGQRTCREANPPFFSYGREVKPAGPFFPNFFGGRVPGHGPAEKKKKMQRRLLFV